MLFILLLAMAFAAPSTAQTNLDSLIDNAPGLDAYPQASAVILFDNTQIRLDSAGQKFTRREFLCKLLAERAKDAFGDQSIRFKDDEDTVVIEQAKTRLADGTWIEPEHDAFTLTSAPEVQWASAYSQLKQQNISFPGMDVGAALYLVYRIEPKAGSHPPETPHAGGTILFGGSEPILDKSFSVDVADNRSIQYEMINDGFEPDISKMGGRTQYVWEKKDCPQIVREPNSVGISFLVPRLSWTTFDSWQALGIYVSEYFWEKVDSSLDAVRGYTEITSAELQGIPALMHMSNFILWNIRDVNLQLGSVGYEPNSADRVWSNRYGDQRDKSVLFTALARLYGFAPIPVLIPGFLTPVSTLPVLEQFHDMILAVPRGDDTLWFDPTAEYYPPGDLPYRDTYGKGCLLVAGTPVLIDVPPGDISTHGARTEFQSSLNMNGDLSGTVSCIPVGDNAARARANFKDQKAQERDIYTQSLASSIGQGTRVTSFTVSNVADLSEPVTVTLGFQSPEYAVRQGDLILLDIPLSPFGFGHSGFYPSLPTVKYPALLPGRLSVVSEFTLSLPESMTVSYLPPPLIVDNRYLSIEIQAHQGESSITWAEELRIKADMVPVDEYAVVRDAYENAALPKNQLIILESKK